MEATSKITLDLLRPQNAVIVYAKQLDSDTRTIEATLLSGGLAYDIPSGAMATFSAARPSGTSTWKDATIVGDKVKYTLSQSDLAVAGDAPAEFVLFSGTERLATFRFLIRIQASVVDENSRTR